jgi:hypothetical protein
MTTRLADASQQAAANAVVDRLDAAAGTLKIYTGSQPADADTDPAGTLLVTINLPAPAYGAANSSGTAALLGTPLSGTGAAAGTAGCFAVETNAGANVFQGSVTATGGGGDLTLDNTSIAVGQTVNISSLNYTHPAG